MQKNRSVTGKEAGTSKPAKAEKKKLKGKTKKRSESKEGVRYSVTKSGILIELPYPEFVGIYKVLFPAAADKLFFEGEYDPSICMRLEMSFSAVFAFYLLCEAYPDHKLSNLKGLLTLFAIFAPDEDRKRLAEIIKQVMAHVAPKAKKQLLSDAESRHARGVRWAATVLTALEKGELMPEKQKARRSGRPTKKEQQESELEEKRKRKAVYKHLLERKPDTKNKPSGQKKGDVNG